MYVVTKAGYKLPVDDSSLPEDAWRVCHDTVGLYEDCAKLKDIWILQLQKQPNPFSKDYELEFVKELRYEHEPTEEEILWAMSAYALTLHDNAFVYKAYELDKEWKDEWI